MKIIKIILVTVLVSLVLSASFSVPLAAQEKKEASKEEMEMMKKWQAYMTPGANHKYLEYFVGHWDSVSSVWMAPGAEPMKEKQEAEYQMLLGGRYLKGYMQGTLFRTPYKAVLVTGYDNFKKKFTSIYFNNLGTGMTTSHGTLDKSGKTRTETGEMDDPMTGKKSAYKTVTRIIDQNKYVFEMYNTAPDGKEYKSFVITNTRKK
ncbi:MAG: DUF1579 domain-containing protein [bacterium]|nr:DUF1579 domain-containing protein [bacterium]